MLFIIPYFLQTLPFYVKLNKILNFFKKVLDFFILVRYNIFCVEEHEFHMSAISSVGRAPDS